MRPLLIASLLALLPAAAGAAPAPPAAGPIQPAAPGDGDAAVDAEGSSLAQVLADLAVALDPEAERPATAAVAVERAAAAGLRLPDDLDPEAPMTLGTARRLLRAAGLQQELAPAGDGGETETLSPPQVKGLVAILGLALAGKSGAGG